MNICSWYPWNLYHEIYIYECGNHFLLYIQRQGDKQCLIRQCNNLVLLGIPVTPKQAPEFYRPSFASISVAYQPMPHGVCITTEMVLCLPAMSK